MAWASQAFMGWSIQSYATYFFTLAGLAASDAYAMSLGMYGLAFMGTVLSWPLQTWYGRRSIFLSVCAAL